MRKTGSADFSILISLLIVISEIMGQIMMYEVNSR
jgi:hypothetical protein